MLKVAGGVEPALEVQADGVVCNGMPSIRQGVGVANRFLPLWTADEVDEAAGGSSGAGCCDLDPGASSVGCSSGYGSDWDDAAKGTWACSRRGGVLRERHVRGKIYVWPKVSVVPKKARRRRARAKGANASVVGGAASSAGSAEACCNTKAEPGLGPPWEGGPKRQGRRGGASAPVRAFGKWDSEAGAALEAARSGFVDGDLSAKAEGAEPEAVEQVDEAVESEEESVGDESLESDVPGDDEEAASRLLLRFRQSVVLIFGSLASALYAFGADSETGRISRRDFVEVSLGLGVLTLPEATVLFSHVSNSGPHLGGHADVVTIRDFRISDEEWRQAIKSQGAA